MNLSQVIVHCRDIECRLDSKGIDHVPTYVHTANNLILLRGGCRICALKLHHCIDHMYIQKLSTTYTSICSKLTCIHRKHCSHEVITIRCLTPEQHASRRSCVLRFNPCSTVTNSQSPVSACIWSLWDTLQQSSGHRDSTAGRNQDLSASQHELRHPPGSVLI